MAEGDSDKEDIDDLFLVKGIRAGDDSCFEVLFKKYYLPLTRFAWRYVHSKAIAEELVQELFTIMWEKRKDWDFVGSIRSYLYKSVRNLSLNHLKHQDIKKRYDQQWQDQKGPSEIKFRDEVRERQIRNAIITAVEELPRRSKMTYKLHRYDGLTYEEIADVMDVSIKTVESQMTRTLKILREKLSYLLPFLLVVFLAS